MDHPLDRPIWTALVTRHAALAEGRGGARRYPADVSPFAATVDDRPQSLADLAALARPGLSMIFMQASPVVLPPGLVPVETADSVQMVAEGPIAAIDDPRIEPLGEADAQEMLALALLTKPGPFTARARDLGDFWGIRRGGALIAMAGERLRAPGHAEVSGVCTHPDARGEGLGRLMLTHVAGRIAARGERPFLHSYTWNEVAIRLYESVGFVKRSAMHVAVVTMREDAGT